MTSPSKFPALFNCSPEIPAWLGGGGVGRAVHEAEEKLAENVESNAARSRAGPFVVIVVIVPPVNLNPGRDGCNLG